MKYVIWGWAIVCDEQGNQVQDRAILRELANYVDEPDLYQTDYLGGTPEENALAEALERSGQLRFSLREGEQVLRVLSTFIARRPLKDLEIELLRNDTLAQWSDGMGESIWIQEGPYKDYCLKPLDADDVLSPGYPFVEIIL
jgi:hypothetical protein